MPRLSVYMIRAALLHLGIGITIGALMLFEKGVSFAPGVWRLLGAHVEIVLFGWTMQLVMGVAFWILPRFSVPRFPTSPPIPVSKLERGWLAQRDGGEVNRSKYGNVTLAWGAFVLLNVGVIIVALGGWQDAPAAVIFAGRVLEMAAAVCFALHAWPRVKPMMAHPPS
jgi:hypothetical protein